MIVLTDDDDYNGCGDCSVGEGGDLISMMTLFPITAVWIIIMMIVIRSGASMPTILQATCRVYSDTAPR